jgi:hypothetical protein
VGRIRVFYLRVNFMLSFFSTSLFFQYKIV